MPDSDPESAARRCPDGYAAVPVHPDQADGPLRLCVLVRGEAAEAGGHLVALRDNLDSRVYLGCVTDAGGLVREWVELWVQTVSAVAGTPAAFRETLSNAVLDARWAATAEALTGLPGGGVLTTGWERAHPAPVYVDVEAGRPVCPTAGSADACWRLCEDDALLAHHQLPAYSTTLHRYLYVSGGGKPSFAPLTPDAPTNAHTVEPGQVAGEAPGLVPLNPEGGLLLVRPFCPLSLDDYLAVLSGGTWDGVAHGRARIDPDGAGARLADAHDSQRSFLGLEGAGGRMVETLHLKLRLLAALFEAARALVRQQQRPLLNLTNESVRVGFAAHGSALPFLWTAEPALTDAGDAVTLPLKSSEVRHFLTPLREGVSIYRPASAGRAMHGRGVARIRQLLGDKRKGTVIEGTLETTDELAVDRHDLVRLRLNLGKEAVDLYAYVEEDSALARGELRFRSVGHTFAEPVAAALKTAEGVPLQNTPFESMPLLSTPCDLYALAVLGAKTLLVDANTKLSVAVDELISLAREAGEGAADKRSLAQRIAWLFSQDERWRASMGPHRLVAEALTPDEAFAYVPPTLWWDALAMLVRMLPGVSGFSACRDYGDARPGALHEVFDRAAQDARELAAKTRGLIVADWKFNREIHNLIDGYIEKVTVEA
ncbi:MAG: hypothetical protein JXR37_07605 [Kiritimatiellae bacterium]|nr:hypothetical protein [Kiritimatiellia bacterium]